MGCKKGKKREKKRVFDVPIRREFLKSTIASVEM